MMRFVSETQGDAESVPRFQVTRTVIRVVSEDVLSAKGWVASSGRANIKSLDLYTEKQTKARSSFVEEVRSDCNGQETLSLDGGRSHMGLLPSKRKYLEDPNMTWNRTVQDKLAKMHFIWEVTQGQG